ncbi:hypothetical protein TWF281_004184 [Arthrobotrys megalospora]
MAILSPNREIESYELRLEKCPQPIDYTFHRVPIGPSHPFLNEHVLAPVFKGEVDAVETKTIRSFHYVRSPGFNLEVTPENDELEILASTTVRELTLNVWRTMKGEVDKNCKVETMHCVRFAFPTNVPTLDKGWPVLTFNLETSQLIFDEEDEEGDEDEE